LLQGQYRIGRVLGKPGGFGITYLAHDIRLDTRVAIKEYLPRDLAGRDSGDLVVSAHSREDGELFRYGLEQFQSEARTLAKFDHAHLVRVRHVFEENGTAYLVMDYYEGLTLAEYLEQRGKLSEKTALDILMPILDGLREVHGKNFLHRDIKPQNIYLTTQGRPILLDFGSARVAMGERSKNLSVVLTPGYAPFEQYHRKGDQGPWTDIYACAAVLYQMITGVAPPEATERAERDHLEAPSRLAPGLTPQVAEAMLRGLAFKAGERPQSIREFQDQLLRRREPPPVELKKHWGFGLAGVLVGGLVIWVAVHEEPSPSRKELEPVVRTPSPHPTQPSPASPSPISRGELHPVLPIPEISQPIPVQSLPHSEPREIRATTAQAAVTRVYQYYAAIGRRDVDAALSQWKSPKNSSKTAALIRNTESAEVREATPVTIDDEHAVVFVDVDVKALDRPAVERWRGHIELEPTASVQWGIVKMNLSPVAATKPVAAPPAVSPSLANDRLTALVRDYYAALDQGNTPVAAAMWKTVPRGFDALVRNVEYFKVNDARVESVGENRATVWVDVIGKPQDGSARRWRGGIELEADSGRWLIASLRNLREVP
jgi:serine/threonine protein kinase